MARLTHGWRRAGVAMPVLVAGLLASGAMAQTVTTQTVLVPTPGQTQILIAPTAPPPPQVEVIPPAPGTTVLWTPGHWVYASGNWVWAPGQYMARPQPAALWVPGQWQPSNGGYSWVEGDWQRAQGGSPPWRSA